MSQGGGSSSLLKQREYIVGGVGSAYQSVANGLGPFALLRHRAEVVSGCEVVGNE